MADQPNETVNRGNRPWISHPGKEDTFTTEAGEHFAKQGGLPARKKLSAEDGELTMLVGGK
jgi:hypothetical protein